MPNQTVTKLKQTIEKLNHSEVEALIDDKFKNWLKSKAINLKIDDHKKNILDCLNLYSEKESIAEPLGIATLMYRKYDDNQRNVSKIDAFDWKSGEIDAILPLLKKASYSDDMQPQFQNCLKSEIPSISVGVSVGIDFGIGFQGSFSVVCDQHGAYHVTGSSKKVGFEVDEKFNLSSGLWFVPGSELNKLFFGIQFMIGEGADVVVTVMLDLVDSTPLAIVFESGGGIGGGFSITYGDIEINTFRKKSAEDNDYIK